MPWMRSLFLQPEPAPGTPAAAAPAPAPEGEFDISKAVAALIKQEHGDTRAVINHLVREGRRYRNRIRAMDEELKTRQPVETGGKVLTPAEAKLFDELRAVAGELPADKVKERLTLAQQLELKEAERLEDERVLGAAGQLQYKRPKLLVDQLKQRNQVVVMKEVEVEDKDGKRTKEQVPHVRARGAKETDPAIRLDQYVDQELKDYKELLLTEPGTPAAPQGGEQRTIPAQNSTRARGPKTDLVDAHAQRYVSPGELRSKSTQQGA